MRLRVLLVSLFALVLVLAGCGDDDPNTVGGNKHRSQKDNDVFVDQDDYTDYFVDDSDGDKDDIFTVYRGIEIQGQRCDVLKAFDSGGIAVICPNREVVQGGRREPDEG